MTHYPPELDRIGVTYRQLDYWCSKGWLKPGNPGTGYQRQWSPAETQVAVRMFRLVEAGLKPAAAAVVARGGGARLTPFVTVEVADTADVGDPRGSIGGVL